jgi:hypothetical protein
MLPILLALGCAPKSPPADSVADTTTDGAVCAADAGGFTLDGTNRFFPLTVGHSITLEGPHDGATVQNVITVLADTEVIAGVTTRVVEEHESEDGALVEISRNFMVNAGDGSVCYFGEDVDIYEDGVITGHESAWRAGVAGASPGIMMPAAPAVGDAYAQEDAPGVAEDRAEVVGVGESLTVPAGTFTDTLHTRESSPLEPGVSEEKWYVSGVGLAVDEVEMTAYE